MNEALNYIRKQKKKGFSDETIKDVLIKNNYPVEFVENLFKQLRFQEKIRKIIITVVFSIMCIIVMSYLKLAFTHTLWVALPEGDYYKWRNAEIYKSIELIKTNYKTINTNCQDTSGKRAKEILNLIGKNSIIIGNVCAEFKNFSDEIDMKNIKIYAPYKEKHIAEKFPDDYPKTKLIKFIIEELASSGTNEFIIGKIPTFEYDFNYLINESNKLNVSLIENSFYFNGNNELNISLENTTPIIFLFSNKNRAINYTKFTRNVNEIVISDSLNSDDLKSAISIIFIPSINKSKEYLEFENNYEMKYHTPPNYLNLEAYNSIRKAMSMSEVTNNKIEFINKDGKSITAKKKVIIVGIRDPRI